MGCNSSTTTAAAVVSQPYRKLVVVDTGQPGADEDKRRLFPNILVYSLTRFHLECTISLPNLEDDCNKQLSSGFSLACHPMKPHLFISGGIYADDKNGSSVSPHVWRVDITPDDDYLMTSLTDLPMSCEGHKTCVCYSCNGEHEYLYAFTEENVMRLNLETIAHWEYLEPLPIAISEVSRVFACGDLFAFLASDQKIYCFDRPSDPSDTWNERSPKLLSEPLVADPGTGIIYAVSADGKSVTIVDVHNNQRQNVSTENLDVSVLKKSHGFTAVGNAIISTGYHYDDDILSVIEIDLDTQQTVALGCLESVSKRHEIFAFRV